MITIHFSIRTISYKIFCFSPRCHLTTVLPTVTPKCLSSRHWLCNDLLRHQKIRALLRYVIIVSDVRKNQDQYKSDTMLIGSRITFRFLTRAFTSTDFSTWPKNSDRTRLSTLLSIYFEGDQFSDFWPGSISRKSGNMYKYFIRMLG